MDLLPSEILLHIFRYVPPRFRRKSVALVCQRWYELTKDERFATDDEIVIGKNANAFDDVADRLAAWQPTTINLLFQNERIYVDENFHRCWQTCGAKITSLNLKNCDLKLTTLKRILKYCANLKNLTVTSRHPRVELYTKSIYLTSQDFIAPSVTSFCFDLHWLNDKTTDMILLKTLSMVPNLINLNLNIFYHIIEVNHLSISLNALHDWMNTVAKQLRKVRLQFLVEQVRPTVIHRFSHLMYSRITNLVKDVKIRFNFKSLQFRIEETLLSAPQFLVENITSLTVRSCNESKGILLMLNSCSNLSHLCLSCPSSVTINSRIVETIFASHLKTLSLQFVDAGFNIDDCYITGNFRSNYSLEKLIVRGKDSWTTVLWRVFLVHFRHLRHIEVDHPNDAILQNIFGYQKRLKNLFLTNCGDCTDYGFTGVITQGDECQQAWSIRELAELENFILSAKGDLGITSRSYSNFIFPELKRFEINVKAQPQPTFFDLQLPVTFWRHFDETQSNLIPTCMKTIIKTLENSHFLEVIELVLPFFVDASEFEQLLSKLKHLRVFKFYNLLQHYGFASSDLEDFFSRYSSLRTVNFCHAKMSFPTRTTKLPRSDP